MASRLYSIETIVVSTRSTNGDDIFLPLWHGGYQRRLEEEVVSLVLRTLGSTVVQKSECESSN